MMGKEIKIRHVHRDIKALDKTVTTAQHMKQTYVRTKDGAGEKQTRENVSPVEYAENKIKNSTDTVTCETVYQVKNQGSKVLGTIRKSGGNFGRRDLIRQAVSGEKVDLAQRNVSSFSSAGAEKDFHQPKEQMRRLALSKRFSNQMVGTRSQSGQAVKTAGKGTVKCAGKAVKTAGQTRHMVIKTTSEAEKSAQMSAKASMKATEMSIRIARQAMRAAKQNARISTNAVIAAVKAIIEAGKAVISTLTVGGGIAVFILILVILFGSVLCMVGDGNSNAVSPVSAEVEAYTPLIRQYANQYGIGEYVELIKAVMMQESGGRGLDPMQSSEGAFNTRYSKRPNGITNPEYSIECGVQELKAALVSAEVKNPIDIEHIKLALQGYNYGNGYISWAKRNYGGYTVANAVEFSDMMAQKMGWRSYGDKQYVSHVLRYYAFGRIPTGIGNQAIVQVALSQEGNVGGEPYWRWYGFNSRVEWCACFVSWCADQCGYIDSGVVPKFSYCPTGAAWFESRGQFRDGNYVPAAGDLIFFDWGKDGIIDHVGIVESVMDGRINTVEGNSRNSCARRTYSIGDSRIYGYGVPQY